MRPVIVYRIFMAFALGFVLGALSLTILLRDWRHDLPLVLVGLCCGAALTLTVSEPERVS